MSAPAKIFVMTLTGMFAVAACAQNFPERPIRLILGVAPGGGQDATARLMAPRLYKVLGETIIIDNRPGAGGAIGVDLARQAAPDGHTLLMISLSNVLLPMLGNVTYDVRRDFAAVAELVVQPCLLVVTAALPVKSVPELIGYAKANAGKLSIASAGTGSLTHLAAELFAEQAQIDVVHVPYKGMGAGYPDLVAGRVQAAFVVMASAQPHLSANRLRALAVTGARRAAFAPALPTMAESGLPSYTVTQWYGVMAPLKTPVGIVNKLNKAFAGVMEDAGMKTLLANDGSEPGSGSPQEFARRLQTEHDRWSDIIEKSGLRKRGARQ